MKGVFFACVLVAVLGGCGSSSPGGSGGDAGSDSGSPNTQSPDAAAGTCPAPIRDAGFTSLEDFPVDSVCTQERLIEWISPCQGSIIVVGGRGVDCSDYWLFDATTHDLQAEGHGCNVGAQCTEGIAGFVFPTSCFDGNFTTNVAYLCRDGG
jgi:hypothetical protein